MEKLAASVAEALPGCRTMDAKAWGWELGRWTARSSIVIVLSSISASGVAKAWPTKSARQTLPLTCTQESFGSRWKLNHYADVVRHRSSGSWTYGLSSSLHWWRSTNMHDMNRSASELMCLIAWIARFRWIAPIFKAERRSGQDLNFGSVSHPTWLQTQKFNTIRDEGRKLFSRQRPGADDIWGSGPRGMTYRRIWKAWQTDETYKKKSNIFFTYRWHWG
jgi:hypothetical protein